MGYCLYQLGGKEDALSAMRQSLLVDPSQPAVLNDIGLIYIQRNEHAAAMPYVQKAIGLNPSLAEAHGNLGICLQARKDYGLAVASYERAIALKPGIDPVYRSNLASLAWFKQSPTRPQ